MQLVVRTIVAALALAFTVSLIAPAQDPVALHNQHEMVDAKPALLPVSKAHSFAALIANANEVMHYGMANASRNGDPDHDFATAMIPHHQGAVDMAKIELLYGEDPLLRRLAQEIIVSQQQEIVVMQRRIGVVQTTPSSPVSERR